MKKQRILLAVPTLDGRVRAQLTHFLCKAVERNHDPESSFTFDRELYIGYKPIDFMRNAIFRDAIAGEYDRVWMLDADVAPPPNAFELLDVDADIVAGAVPGFTASTDAQGIAIRLLVFKRLPDGSMQTLSELPETDCDVDAAGGGCLLIHRDVLTDPAMHLATEGEYPSIYRVRTETWGRVTTSGDIDFCERAKALGYSIKLWHGAMFGQMAHLELCEVADYAARCIAAERITA